ncbi:hypothetical protein CDV36_010992 [Fusarium kuroshium]|uniref:Uncharacterized protein n=1 Tax=Fusarium kuroshium TaxID=2010991 RepID=A0A3M2RVT0_9HYPO|nr:hypothetical protein CDV36_010992 [Fusarium kuroshium]
MLRRLSSFSAIALAVLLASVCHASPDDGIPKQWRKSVPLIWDYTYTRYLNEPSPNLATYPNWALEQIIDGLLGIFGVNMPLLYGEGSKAFLRLQQEIARFTNDLTLFA